MQLSGKIKVVLAEDEVILRQNIAAKIVKLDSDFTIAAQADDGLQALETIGKYAPEILMTDIKMPGMDGMELVEKVSRTYPKVKIVILSGYADFSYMQQAIRFGVARYLLKPVEDEELMDVLRDLKNEVLTAQYVQKHSVFYSDGYTRGMGHLLDNMLFAVCMGNLCYDGTDAYMQNFYDSVQRIDRPKVLADLDPKIRDWYVSDEEEPNLKLFCCRVSPGDKLDVREVAEKLRARLEAAMPELPVNICASQYPQKREDLWMCAQRCKNLLHQQVVPGHSSLFLLERDERMRSEELLGIVKMRVQEQLRQSIEKKEREEVRRELELIFRYMVDHSVPQQDMQKVILYILRMCEFSGQGAVTPNQAKILRVLSCTTDSKQLTELLVAAILQEIAPGEEGTDLGIQLVEYVNLHYLHLDHLEDITQAFQYNYAYLSRLFKKQTGVSLNAYVLEKRLELAKRLIENNDALNMAQIAQMAGFSDRRYFLRAFKNYTGQSPSEYKNEIIVKG